MKDKMIVALDFSDMKTATEFVLKMSDNVSFYKVGLELFLNTRGEIIDFLKLHNKKIFLDLKFHDIPNTTAMAGLWASSQKVDIFNVHAGGGKKMMETVRKLSPNNMIIGVTVLTSFNEEEIYNTYKSELNLKELAINLARITYEAGLNGVVCSPWEAKSIKEKFGKNFKTICPGVRPTWAATNDQKRIMTPYEAIKNGCDYLVIGRPITKNENPIKASQLILKEIEEAINC